MTQKEGSRENLVNYRKERGAPNPLRPEGSPKGASQCLPLPRKIITKRGMKVKGL